MTSIASKLSIVAAVALSGVFAGTVQAQMAHHNHQPQCEGPVLQCAAKATPAFGADGSLWVVLATADRTFVVRSKDDGRTFSDPVAVHQDPLSLDWGPDARPQIAVSGAGNIYVTFNTFRDKAFNGQIFFTRSTDGGLSFQPPRPITDNAESQRFQAIALGSDGSLFAAWLDKRNRVPAAERGQKYVGAGLAYAWSRDDGRSFTAAEIAHDNTCECCRLGIGFAAPNRPAIVFRNVFDGTTRDHAVMTFDEQGRPGPVHRVSIDDWRTDACPHHGPSLSIGPNKTYHVTWYSNGRARQGLFYARSIDGGATFSQPMPIGPGKNASRPYLMAAGGAVWMVWKEFDGEQTKIMMMISRNDGQSWSSPSAIARTTEDSDHPLLVARGDAVFLSWMVPKVGYTFRRLEARS